MSNLDKPMFPQSTGRCPACKVQLALAPGKSARVYAAIHLCVPESGDAELDAMIRKAQRQRLAGMAMQGMLADGEALNEIKKRRTSAGVTVADGLTVEAYACADAMIAQREKKP